MKLKRGQRAGEGPSMQIERLESRRLLAGVTVLSHGQSGNIDGWVKKFADDITLRAGGTSNVSQYVMTINKNQSNQLNVTSYARSSGFPAPITTPGGEIIIKLDWSAVSGGAFSTV